MKNKTVTFILWLLICQIPSAIGGVFVYGGMAWYTPLNRPALVPPSALFGVVWTVLYILLGISGHLLIGSAWRTQPKITALFLGQLVLNALWTPVFFGLHSLPGAVVVIMLMICQCLWLMRAAWRQNKTAAWLMVPYFIWLCFAAYLTTGYWWLN